MNSISFILPLESKVLSSGAFRTDNVSSERKRTNVLFIVLDRHGCVSESFLEADMMISEKFLSPTIAMKP